ncbi:Hsp20/alpha crystallin family protein [Niastella caeni]|uniref:Hsp20/alpha crystallin family protein n=1 Tax=Niastella caeni TaxID=2569763 RepID=A0A4V4H1N4_9BACT|nr:Hsp20/alpha crystallin family protein [Niastella caeni]THU41086.1 Hsp20/alpha crystallin family protein [Niastella caeni]
MANIMKRENSRQPATFGSVVDQIFQNNLSRFFDDSFWGLNAGEIERAKVPVNLRETDATYEMELVAPGLRKEDFQLNVSGDILTVSFEEKNENKEMNKEEGWVRQEYRKHSFSRNFHLNDAIDANSINARYENGILYVTLPKNEKAKQVLKTIKVA